MIYSNHGLIGFAQLTLWNIPPAFPGSVGLAPRNVTTLAHISASSASFPKSGRRQHKHDTAQMWRSRVFKTALSAATTGILQRTKISLIRDAFDSFQRAERFAG
jgi:hypothetical protein